MAIYLGENKVSQLWLGKKKISRIWMDDSLIYDRYSSMPIILNSFQLNHNLGSFNVSEESGE